MTNRNIGVNQTGGYHARALLDSLCGPKTGATCTTFSSSSSSNSPHHLTPSFKPHKPSSLSSSASASASEDDEAQFQLNSFSGIDDSNVLDSDDHDSNIATSPPFSSSFKAAQISLQTQEPFYRSNSSTSESRPSLSLISQDPVADIMSLLYNPEIDQEEKIDKVRVVLANALCNLEGVVSPSSRLDNLVLDLMHRHREDINPSGVTFAPLPNQSPSRRAATIRSFSTSRSWTPSRPPFSLATTNSTGLAVDPSSTPQPPTSPLFGSAVLTSFASNSSSLTASVSPKLHPGVIGSGSPRASPRPWNRALSNVSSTSISSTNTGTNHASSPISSVPPGLIGSSASRPASPSPLGSPRLNVAATEFRPRKSSNASLASVSGLTPTRPSAWLIRRPSSNASSTNLALANKSHAGAGDDDEDEFSPFGTIKPLSYQSTHVESYGGQDQENSWYTNEASTSYPSMQWDRVSGSHLIPDPEAEHEVDGFSSTTMTPFDMLYSILVQGTKYGASEWSPEQVDEALLLHSYDVEKALNSILENGGKPLGDGSQSSLSVAVNHPAGTAQSYGNVPVSSLTPFTSAPLPPTAGVRAGVNVLSREAFSSTLRAGSPRFTPGIKNVANISSPNSGSSFIPANLAGPGGNSRVCRYFLAGECRRSDCKFSHEVGRAVCRYWLKGQCAHNPCNFLHDFDALSSLASGITSAVQIDDGNSYVDDPQHADSVSSKESESAKPRPSNEDFPELGPTPQVSSSKNGSQKLWASNTSDPTRNRWATAVQKKGISPLSQVQKEDQGIISLYPKTAPTRVAASTSNASLSAFGGPTLSKAYGKIGSTGGRGSGRVPLRAPLLLPRIDTGKIAAQAYQDHRGESIYMAEQRNKLLARASEAFKLGDFASAKKWSKEASEMNGKLESESRDVSRRIVKQRMEEIRRKINDPIESGATVAGNQSNEAGARSLRGKVIGSGLGVCLGVVKPSSLQSSMPSSMASHLSMEERTESLLDLHCLHSKEAVEVVEEFLLGLEREGIQGLAYLAVGKEKHSSRDTDRRRIKVAGFIKQFLSSFAYPFAECDGVLVVDPCTHI